MYVTSSLCTATMPVVRCTTLVSEEELLQFYQKGILKQPVDNCPLPSFL